MRTIMGYLDLMSRPAQFAEPREQDRIEPERLAEEQAALRRVATLVAQAASSTEVFSAVAQEVAEVLHVSNTAVCRYDDQDTVMTVLAVWGDHPDVFSAGSRWPLDGPSMSAEVLRTGRPVRIEDYADLPGGLAAAAREHGFNRVAGAPIIVDGRVWGVISTSSPDAPLPANLEDRLGEFTELVATAIANSQAHDELTRLAEEQAALRRVATLAAQGAPPAEVFEAVSSEVAQLVHAEDAGVTRYEADGTFTALGGWTTTRAHAVTGRRYALEGSLSGLIFETRGPSRIDDFAARPGPAAAAARELGWRSAAGAPIFVEGRLWGALLVYSRSDEPLPAGTGSRLAEFTEIVAAAIASAENGQGLADLLEEQAALRRVATLVAAGAPAADVFMAVSAEVAALVDADGSALTRYEADGSVTAVGGWATEGGYKYVGTRYPLEGTVSGVIFETHRPGRVDNYTDAPGEAPQAAREMGWHSSVGAPITVEGRLWGVLAVVSRRDRQLPLDTERRLVEFTELVASAIANSQAREEVGRLAEEQAALRRVATLVAGGAEPAEVFEAVCAEVGRVIPADVAALSRHGADGKLTTLGSWTRTGGYTGINLGEPFPLEHGTTAHQVFATRRPARIDTYEGAPGRAAAAARQAGFRSAVGSPIVVEGRLWGVVIVASTTDRPLPPDAEERLPEFADLLGTAIANAESRAELDASRARIVATADATRRRIERDLHDGAQQQLISLALELRAAQAAAPPAADHQERLSHAVEELTSVLDGLREIALGIHPAILAEGGLAPALKTLARRSPVPVELDLQVDGRLAERVEVAAYYVVSEALTNAAKHARASNIRVDVAVEDDVLRVAVRDDGLGGADARGGSGLLGLKDRAEAIGGSFCVESTRGAGTSLTAELPLDTLSP